MMVAMRQKVIVTGGLGLIGSHLSRALVKQGYRVTIIDAMVADGGANMANIADIIDDVEIVKQSLLAIENLDDIVRDCHLVFHLAGVTSHQGSVTAPLNDLSYNLQDSIALFDSCARSASSDIKIVFTSTRQLYGKSNLNIVSEAAPINPPDPNAIHNYACEQYLGLYGKIHNLSSISLRLTNTFGKGMRIKDARQMFLGYWIGQMIQNQPITILGDGQQERDLLAVSDCVSALLVASQMARVDSPVFNVGSDHRISLKDLADLLVNIRPETLIKNQPFPEALEKIDIGSFKVDDRSFREASSWSPMTELRPELENLIAYYETHKDKYIGEAQ